MSTRWWKYLDSLRNPDMSDRKLALFIDVTPATVSRWKSGQAPGSAEVVRAARAFGANVVDALVAGGVLSTEEAEDYVRGQLSLADVPLAALLSELETRLDALKVLDTTRSADRVIAKRIPKGFLQ